MANTGKRSPTKRLSDMLDDVYARVRMVQSLDYDVRNGTILYLLGILEGEGWFLDEDEDDTDSDLDFLRAVKETADDGD